MANLTESQSKELRNMSLSKNIFSRKESLVHEGEHYQILTVERGDGARKAAKKYHSWKF